MKKILFPYDFSKASLNAFQYAVHFANESGTSITTLHVYDRLSANDPEYYRRLTHNYDLEEWDQLGGFTALLPELNAMLKASQAKDLKISHLLEHGNPANVIAEVCKRENIDCVVMGTVGATGLSEIFLGSVAEKVMNDAACDVIAVPAGHSYSVVTKILYLTDLEDYGFRMLAHVLAFAEVFHAQVDVLQIKPHLRLDDHETLQKWKRRFKNEKNLDFHIHAGLVADEVAANFIEAAKISLVAVAKRHKSLLRRVFLYSLSQQLAFHAKVPVLGLQAKN